MVAEALERAVHTSTLLVIDDEPNLLYSLRHSLESDDLRVLTADTARYGLERLEGDSPDAVLLDIRLPDMSGLDVLERIQKLRPQLPVIVITAHGTTETAIEATKRGAFDYLLKPFDLRQLRTLVQRALDVGRQSRDTTSLITSDAPALGNQMVGTNAAMQDVYKAIGRVAPTDLNVLLLGETGTGKEMVAQAIYRHSRRRERPFTMVHCGVASESALESELFGDAAGTGPGDGRPRVGRAELSSGGTLFFDEIGDLRPSTQARLLRLLQEQRFERPGSDELVSCDVRVIAATNQNLEELVDSGRFRRDLYFRLKSFSIQLPALRDRLDDLPLLVEHFIRLYADETGRRVRQVSDETLKWMQRYLWPGNVLELQGAVRYALVHAATDVLTPDTLPPNVAAGIQFATQRDAPTVEHRPLLTFLRALLQTGDEDIYRKVIYLVDRMVLDEVLKAVGGNQVEASRRLGISRTTLRAKLQTQRLNEQSRPDTPQEGGSPSFGTAGDEG